jgi:hypothetical protein
MLCMYVCIYVCIYVCVGGKGGEASICASFSFHLLQGVRIYNLDMYVYMYLCGARHTSIQSGAERTLMCLYIYMYICIYIYIYIYIYILHTHTHTRTYSYIHVSTWFRSELGSKDIFTHTDRRAHLCLYTLRHEGVHMHL